MATLLLRLAGPMQSWGVGSKLNTRNTSREPSKSAILGMIAAAFGRSRDESIDDFLVLKFGVRIDQEGTIMKDYHTAHNPDDSVLSFITNRYYLSDAVFLVGLEGDDGILQSISNALTNPFFPLFLGRRSCPPTGKMVLGIRDYSIREALNREPWQASPWYRRRSPEELDLEIVCDASDQSDSIPIRDMPISFSQTHRIYGFRNVSFNGAKKHIINIESKHHLEIKTTHDAFSVLKED